MIRGLPSSDIVSCGVSIRTSKKANGETNCPYFPLKSFLDKKILHLSSKED